MKNLNTLKGALLRFAKAFALTATTLITAQTNSQAQLIYGLSGSNLVAFNVSSPSTSLLNVPITGITAGQTVSGMDFRPNTGQLYAIGYDATNGNAQLYVVNRNTGAATSVAAPVVLALGTGKISMDFNPTVDRIRVTGSNNANYRLHPVTGAIAATDLNLAYAVGDVNAAADPSVGTVAYTNSYIGASATTLYDYDDSLNVLITQNPPNNGTLNTVGSSGIVVNLADPTSDMDIFFNTSTLLNSAYLVANTGGSSIDALYSVNLTTGAATLVGSTGLALQDIAAYINRTIPSNITGQLVYALASNNNLLGFDSDVPSIIRASFAVTGITVGQTLVGLDFRPLTGQMYAMGYNSTNGETQLYTLNRNIGVATSVAAPVTLALGTGKVSMDFNPTVDRIRVTGSNNANYRLHPVTGAIAATDLNLAFAAGDPNAASDPSVGTVAYTNSYIGSTSTTLYNYDDSLNVLTTQNPPNNGTLNTIGSSGIVVNLADPTSDLDIGTANAAFFAANVGSSVNDNLYTVNLTTGEATLAGGIGYGISIRDIAVFINRNVPSNITGDLVYALTSNNNIIGFDSDAPSIIRGSAPVTDVTAGQTIVGMDFRPLNRQLYGLGYNATNGEAQIYNINRSTGAAVAVNATPIILGLGTTDVGMDFNPTVDRIRVVGANDANYRLNPITGAIAATDLTLVYAPGDPNAAANPAVGAVAYTNSFNGATTTQLFDYDAGLNILALQNPPNNGLLNTIGSSGITLNPADASADLDIHYDAVAVTNTAYMNANTGSSLNDNLYTVNVATGAATLVGGIGAGIAVRDIAVYIYPSSPFVNDETRFGVNENSNAITQLNVYPNPVQNSTVGYINFKTEENSKIKIVVSDVTGRIISTVLDKQLPQGTYEADWNTSGLKAGMYFIQLYTNDKVTEISKAVVK